MNAWRPWAFEGQLLAFMANIIRLAIKELSSGYRRYVTIVSMFKVPVLPLPRPGPPTLLPVLTLPLHPLLISLHRYRRLNPRPSCLHILHHHVIVICDPISTKKTWISVLRIKFHHRYFSSRLLKSHFHACLTTVIDEIIRVIIPFKPRACMRSKKPRLMRWWSECVHCIGYCTDEGFVEFPGS